MAKRRGQAEEVLPSARRLITSLRDMGYDFNEAVADLVDNSITAGATCVTIDVKFDGNESWIRIADNGIGMGGPEILEAMRFGSNREYADEDLGKFGLGLKTASLSQCTRLTVASRKGKERNRTEVRQLDLDHVLETDRWEVLNLGPDERDDRVVEPLEGSPGTVILWEKLDRVLEYKNAYSERARAGLLQITEELDLHLAMVFHRFLAGTARGHKKLRISLNEEEIEAWDPFAISEKSKAVAKKEFVVNTATGRGVVRYKPYVLPAKHEYKSESIFNRLAGPKQWNQQQGFYIYRADRLIQSGGWCGLRTRDEHTKYARAALEFSPDLDAAFGVNVSKTRLRIPAELRNDLKTATAELCKVAKERYSPEKPAAPPAPAGGGGNGGGNGGNGVPAPSPRTAGKHSTGGNGAVGTMPSAKEALEQAADAAGERPALKRIVRELRKQNREISKDLGW